MVTATAVMAQKQAAVTSSSGPKRLATAGAKSLLSTEYYTTCGRVPLSSLWRSFQKCVYPPRRYQSGQHSNYMTFQTELVGQDGVNACKDACDAEAQCHAFDVNYPFAVRLANDCATASAVSQTSNFELLRSSNISGQVLVLPRLWGEQHSPQYVARTEASRCLTCLNRMTRGPTVAMAVLAVAAMCIPAMRHRAHHLRRCARTYYNTLESNIIQLLMASC